MSEKSNDDEPFIVYSLDDDTNLGILGKIIGTKYARKFLKITQENTLPLKDIAKQVENHDNPPLSNTHHHARKLKDVGLVKTELIKQRRRGRSLKHYTAKKIIIIVPEHLVELIRNNPELKNILKEITKISGVGICAVATYFTSHELFNQRHTTDVSFDAIAAILSGMVFAGLYLGMKFLKSRKLNFTVH